jgi:antitoxin CptB
MPNRLADGKACPALSHAARAAADSEGDARYKAPPGAVRAFGVGNKPEEPMTGTTRSSEGLDVRRRRLLFRSWHRGMREMDLIVGRFSDHAIDHLSDAELADFENLLEVPDRDLLAWVTGEVPVPPEFDTALFRRMRDFHWHGGRQT